MSVRRKKKAPQTGQATTAEAPSIPLVPAASAGPRVIAIASGKGGVGKSFFVGSLSWALAQAGKRVVAVDADFGGPNLHTCLSVERPAPGGWVELEEGRPMEEVLSQTSLPNLQVVCGAREPLHSPNIKTSARRAALSRLRELPVDFVLLDLGAGSAYSIVDIFLLADQGLVLSTPEPTAMENAYRFLKTLFFRFVAGQCTNERMRQLVTECLYAGGGAKARSPVQLLQEIDRRNAGLARAIEGALSAVHLSLIANQVRYDEDADLAEAMSMAVRKVFALPCESWGAIPYDENVGRALRRRQPYLTERPDSDTAAAVRALAQRLIDQAAAARVSLQTESPA
ncbi:MAG: P-loop NTPase [Chrysiogenetes bacterium]|nr:P-loop NTPase [Chrysiogenetes bacterium]